MSLYTRSYVLSPAGVEYSQVGTGHSFCGGAIVNCVRFSRYQAVFAFITYKEDIIEMSCKRYRWLAILIQMS